MRKYRDCRAVEHKMERNESDEDNYMKIPQKKKKKKKNFDSKTILAEEEKKKINHQREQN